MKYNKILNLMLLGAMCVGFTACEQKIKEVYQAILITDNLEGATAKVNKDDNIEFADEVKVTVKPNDKNYVWQVEPTVTATNATLKSTETDNGKYTFIFTAFQDNSFINVTGIAGYSYNSGNGSDNGSGSDDYSSDTKEAVDLGLPSGTLWATCNVGATRPEEYGAYFAWGETTTKSTYDWTTYKWCKGSYDTQIKYCNDSDYGYNGFTDNKTTLDLSDDAARVNWGGDWRMPTLTEMQELLDSDNCTWSWTTQNGIYGRKVTSKTNGNSIFLPTAGYHGVSSLLYDGMHGYYWSSSLNTNDPDYAYDLYFNSDSYDWNRYYRYYGLSIRAVCSPK